LNNLPHTPLWLGVTGHRPNKLRPEAIARIWTQTEHVLDELAAICGGLGIVSGMAEGADRIVVKLALSRGFELRCVLPFAAAEYERDFASQQSREEFLALLGHASRVDELAGNPEARSAAYEAAGRAMLDQCDILLAIWDGRPAAGRGGSAQMANEAVARRMPIIWIDSENALPPVFRFDGDTPFAAAQRRLGAFVSGLATARARPSAKK
jgi:hypothetical protein